ncbi:MAG TPA: hypothetical protein VGS20_08240 [Candidatus Acidoferrales bacterium]|nr:hypothetical protein [Candidatus Acidoferrales bacterium]
MSNRAYFSVWCRDFGEPVMLERFEQFLGTVPLSETQPGFANLVVRAIGPDQTPLLERDLRAAVLEAADVARLAGEWLQPDCCAEVQAYWDLWTYDVEAGAWGLGPHRLEILCQGEAYDDEAWRDTGHFWIHAGFEYLFTGHAGLLSSAAAAATAARHPAEAEFLDRMVRPGNLGDYRQKTQQNIRKLIGWAEQAHRAMPVDRWRLWSEGEENLEARLESILTGR